MVALAIILFILYSIMFFSVADWSRAHYEKKTLIKKACIGEGAGVIVVILVLILVIIQGDKKVDILITNNDIEYKVGIEGVEDIEDTSSTDTPSQYTIKYENDEIIVPYGKIRTVIRKDGTKRRFDVK